MKEGKRKPDSRRGETIALHGARVALGPNRIVSTPVFISEGRISHLSGLTANGINGKSSSLDLSGYLLMPGFVNAHDHLDFALFPRIAHPPYRNYIEWGEEIHRSFPDVLAKYRAVPKEVRAWWGGIGNLLCGVTTVCHHNPLLPEMQDDDFPVRVVREYGWAHSLALGGDLRATRAIVPRGKPFIVHACEGLDRQSRDELFSLDRLGLLEPSTVLVHGLAMDAECVQLMRKREVSLILCPSSNEFLFHKLPDFSLLSKIEGLALGSDSHLTSEGDLLDEVRFAIARCKIPREDAYRMVTTAPASILRLKNSEGSIRESGVGDLIAIRDNGANVSERIAILSAADIELVLIAGRVQLASEAILHRLSVEQRHGLQPLVSDGVLRWVRTPVKELLLRTEAVLGSEGIRLGRRLVEVPEPVGAEHV